ITAALLTKIAPSTSSCISAPILSECANATVAAPAIVRSFNNYDITSLGEQAALISLILYESGDFKYNKNHFPPPGVPGQGTRNMQSAKYNEMYAREIGIEDPMLDENASFGSAAWFLTTQCTEEVRRGLESGEKEEYRVYLEDCVGTRDTEEREKVWEK
ncbi:hypothetical protein BCR34DRAFT_434481, partial [Clohesyomyces aquaticus]